MGQKIEPEVIYQEHELTALGWFTELQLRRGRNEQGLRYTELTRGKRSYRGSWLLDWLEQASIARGRSKGERRRTTARA